MVQNKNTMPLQMSGKTAVILPKLIQFSNLVCYSITISFNCALTRPTFGFATLKIKKTVDLSYLLTPAVGCALGYKVRFSFSKRASSLRSFIAIMLTSSRFIFNPAGNSVSLMIVGNSAAL